MKTRFLALFGLFLVAAMPAAGAVEVQRVISPGGIEAWLVEDHTNPILAVQLGFDGGAAQDPQGKEGLANMVSGLLDEGAGPMDSLNFQQTLEDNSISLRFSAGKDTFQGSLQTLTEKRDLAFDMLRLALTEPRFDDEPVSRIRSQIQAQLAREQQSPDSVAWKEWYRVMFPGHPYGTPSRGTEESVAAIQTADLKGFAKAALAKDNLKIGIVGDITPAQLKPLLDKTFGALPAKTALAKVAEAEPAQKPGVTVIARNNPQSVAAFGHGGVKRDDPDYYAAYVVNYILGGGGFASRLTETVREKRGLAYSVYSYLMPMDRAGLVAGGVATQNARVAESLDLIRQEWARMAEQGPSQTELTNAKTYLTGSFPLQLDSSGSIAQLLVGMQMEDLGIDYLDKRNTYIEAVTLDDAKRVAESLFQPDNLNVVVVGSPDGLTATP